MLPKITELEFEIEQLPQDLPPIGKSFLYDLDTGEFVLRDGKMIELNGIESLKMWIRKVIKTERFRFGIYENTEYGITLEDLIGSNFPRSFIESEIKREVTSTLTRHPNIESIDGWKFERDGKWMRVNFRVTTAYETFDVEVNM